MIFPPEALGRGLVGGDKRAVEAIGSANGRCRFRRRKLMAISNGLPSILAGLRKGRKRLDMVADRGSGGTVQGEDPFVALIDGRHFGTDLQAVATCSTRLRSLACDRVDTICG
jgi:hypothetical protein